MHGTMFYASPKEVRHVHLGATSGLARISHQAAQDSDKALVSFKKTWLTKIQCVFQVCLSRFRLVFVSVSLLFTQTVAIATLYAPERRLRTPARLSCQGTR